MLATTTTPNATERQNVARLAAAQKDLCCDTILLVEDDEPVRRLLARGLIARGYDILEACNGEQALDVAQAHNAPIHLVVSDVVMPEMDGGELFDRMRAWYPNIRFLFISGYTQGVLEAFERRQGRTTFLSKPFDLEALCSAMRRLLDQGPD